MSDEKLRLEAEVRDNMSGPLRKIRETLNSIKMSPGMEAATDGIRRLGTETKNFATFGGSAATALDAIGIGGLATAGSLAGVVAQMRALGERTLEMKEFARETSVSVDWLNAWAHAGQSFGVNADSMQSALNHLSAQMPEFQRHMGSLFFLMSQRWPNLTEKLLGEGAEDQVRDIIAQLDKLKNEPQLQKQLASEFFGNGDDIEKLMRNGAKGFFDEFERQRKALNPVNPELAKQAQAFRDATIQFNDALENFENKAGPRFLKTMSGIVDEAKTLVDDINGKTANPEEPKKLWSDLKSGDIVALGKELGKVAADSFRAEAGLPPAEAGADPDKEARDVKKSLDNGDIRKWLSQPPANSLFHKSAFVTGGDAGGSYGLVGIITDGTKAGVLAAFRELMALQDAKAAGSGSPGIMNASFETGGGDGGGSGFGGGYSGGGSRAGRLGGSGGGDGDLLGPDTPTGSASLGRGAKGMQGRAEETYAFWRKLGFSRNAALGFVGNEQGETGLTGGPKLHWDGSHYSGGLVQWDPARRAAIAKALGIDVWHDRDHLHQLEAEAWELKTRYPKLWDQLRRTGISIGQAAHGLVRHYELPADPEGQSRLRGGFGAAWGGRLHDRKATGLADGGSAPSGGKAPPEGGHIRADVHVHGDVKKATVRSVGRIEAKLHRWPQMEFA
jgi:hypothetical protein